MNISLSPEMAQFVAERVQSGAYQTANDVVREGLLLLRIEEEHKRKHNELKHAIQEGIDSLDRGEGLPLNEEEIERILAGGRARRQGEGGLRHA